MSDTASHFNIADRVTESAERWPLQQAIVFPQGRDGAGRVSYTQLTFRQLEQETNRLADGLRQMGVQPGERLVLMVKPSLEFIALTFAIFKTGATVVLIDPGMGRKRIFRCLDLIDPHGFVAIPPVHVIRKLRFGSFPNAKHNVSVGGRVNLAKETYAGLLKRGKPDPLPPCTTATDTAAIIFTSGSTGPPKGVVYEHGMFNAQVDLLQQQYNIQPGERDLPGFPLFALFNLAMGVTTVIPDMNPTKPAHVNPLRILEGIENQGITQAYGSPALWHRVGQFCNERNIIWPQLNRVLSAGAPVPVRVLESMQKVCSGDETEIHTPYGATESLPVCTIGSRTVLNETAALTNIGRGTCVGHRFPQVDLQIIQPVDGPIADIGEAKTLPPGEIGEIIVRSPSATREYFRRPEATAAAKIPDGERFWHRMGDMGYLDKQDRLWFCGRKAHIVHTEAGPMYPVCCEPIFNLHPHIYRSALVGVGPVGQQAPVLIAEPEPGQFPDSAAARRKLAAELRELGKANEITQSIGTFLFHRSLPVDRRHNVKIHREDLSRWATKRIKQAVRIEA
ncbi:fatty acid CoA ligase family protein [Rubinisphaera brasiliensis]|uniref:Long-chain-fatty-acid--CoA ligase n=1 Tax=Rubinisphaera brasiliensis (strain ATCC 49424 / DSM 5305 / JCM 21570 / IAM 15109 / NBRC 103401 / IFAM 1448) TaxID=756272 RepID=F0SPA8_RUBBR|nr:fatty acid CoA ligase family protein [Rubinisphaera brasiliensis]ADY62216.1 Long-chain-fatty-acid--CoA ligase [Rubinisphaera brasiliensis DSM 5305]